HIGLCNGACAGLVSAAENRAVAEEFVKFMESDGSDFIRARTADMKKAAAVEDFERAAKLRDEITAMTTATERNVVV
ncbi:UvrB/UvrC motif-containing protein, partial [Actinotignum urinale]